jgi:hypothetical protein
MRASFVLAALFAVACGSGSSVNQPPGSGSNGSDAGPVVTTPPVDAGIPDAGGPLDAGPADGGVLTDDCDGLLPPAPGNPVVVEVGQLGNTAQCLPGTSDGSGNVALEYSQDSTSTPEPTQLLLFDGTGAQRGTRAGENTGLFEALSGYLVFDGLGATSASTIDPAGHVTAATGQIGEETRFASNNPLGGAVLAVATGTDGVPALIVSYDEHLHERWRAPVPIAAAIGLGVDRLGRTLILGDGRAAGPNQISVSGVWLDEAGHAGSEFTVGTGTNSSWTAVPRVGSGLFVRDFDKNWVAQVDSLAVRASAAPAWLAAQPGSNLHLAHGGTAYAVIHPVADSCDQLIEVVAASGKSCGSVSFGCSLPAVQATIGYDGTVIQQIAAAPAGTDERNCRWRWWTGFFH